MEFPSIGLHPEGEAGLWVFCMSMPGIGQIAGVEVKVQTQFTGEEVPADVTSNAVHVMRIATGEIEEGTPFDDGKDRSAKALGSALEHRRSGVSGRNSGCDAGEARAVQERRLMTSHQTKKPPITTTSV